jgi:hypothetical protein
VGVSVPAASRFALVPVTLKRPEFRMRTTPLIMTSPILVEHHSETNAGTFITPSQSWCSRWPSLATRSCALTGTLPSTAAPEMIIAEISVDLMCMIVSVAAQLE